MVLGAAVHEEADASSLLEHEGANSIIDLENEESINIVSDCENL